jgi:arylformamidase
VTLQDISVPIREGMPIYDDNPGFAIGLHTSIDSGADANVSEITMGAHTGTHVDGPSHFFTGAGGVERLDLEAMLGPCEVVAIPERGLDPIDEACLERARVPAGSERLLLKTTNSRLWERREFTHEFIRLDESGAAWVLERGIRLIGIDYLSIGDQQAHRALLGGERPVVALEGLDLREIAPGSYELICLPLNLPGSDGCPCRALLRG